MDKEDRSTQKCGKTRIGRSFFIAIVALLLVGAGYQQWSQAWVEAHHPPPGKLVEVLGRQMHIHCTGTGSPTVVLEAGATGFAQSWAWVQKSLSRENRVCSYDRAGLGWSEGGGARHTGLEAARNLRLLLQSADEQGPFVLVGHSMGGPLVQIFTGLYPDQVIGVGLVDPSHPDQLTRYDKAARPLMDEFTQALRVASWLSFTGIVRLTDALAQHAQGLPKDALLTARTFASSRKHLMASYQELERWDFTMTVARQFMQMGDRPLLVISATQGRSDFPQEYVERFQVLHAELARMSTQARHVRVPGADHFTLLTQEKYAGRTAELIQALVERVRAQRWQPEKPHHQRAVVASRAG